MWTMTDSVEAWSGERGGMLFTTLQQIHLMSATVLVSKVRMTGRRKAECTPALLPHFHYSMKTVIMFRDNGLYAHVNSVSFRGHLMQREMEKLRK